VVTTQEAIFANIKVDIIGNGQNASPRKVGKDDELDYLH
jgi:hypothetical protein